MAIKPKFTPEQVRARLDSFFGVVEDRILKRLQYLGELCVTHARLNGDYRDQTGNLRASVGYAVFKNGRTVTSDYNGAVEGVSEGKALAEKVGAEYKSGWALVVTAGMDYAVAVESRGRDVLTSAELLAKQQLPIMLLQLKSNINKALE